MREFSEGVYDAAVIGAGHAGCEAALALARTGLKTVMLTLNLDAVAFMACNPSVGGTAKAHLVREIDALGGEMGVNADETALQMRMLNTGKGAAVRSLRCQSDKNAYHSRMKRVLESEPNLRVLQAEVEEILVSGGAVRGVRTTYGGVIGCRAVVVATGVYLNSRTITGGEIRESGPNGFARAERLSGCLSRLGFTLRRFKTGTPARVSFRSVDTGKCEEQRGDDGITPFSFMTDRPVRNTRPCYLTYTNGRTHGIIRENLARSPLYDGTIEAPGPRYCPSIETKVVRFPDRERHQVFIEPEGADTDEAYVQGMSSSLPHDVQREMYSSVAGLEHCEITRYAYAIEYDCIDTLDLLPTLESKKVRGLYTAGQINGTSGYEEAAAQGLVAGLNASLALRGMDPLVLGRDEAYIGVLVDDIVTKGCEEPYRMMTSRAEYRVVLRQDNADMRLTEKGRACGLVTDERYARFLERKELCGKARDALERRLSPDETERILARRGFGRADGALTCADLIRRGITADELDAEYGVLSSFPLSVRETVETDIRYEGYIRKTEEQIAKAKRMEERLLPPDADYLRIEGLRMEARERLDRVRPRSLGQAGRIYGVNPADVAVLMVWLSSGKDR